MNFLWNQRNTIHQYPPYLSYLSNLNSIQLLYILFPAEGGQKSYRHNGHGFTRIFKQLGDTARPNQWWKQSWFEHNPVKNSDTVLGSAPGATELSDAKPEVEWGFVWLRETEWETYLHLTLLEKHFFHLEFGITIRVPMTLPSLAARWHPVHLVSGATAPISSMSTEAWEQQPCNAFSNAAFFEISLQACKTASDLVW